MSESVSYALYLSSFPKAPYSTNLSDSANTKYAINWDSFFNRDNYRYRSCRIRHAFLSDPSSTAGYSYDPSNFNGVIVANGLNSTNTSPYGGLILGLIDIKCIPFVSATVANNNTTVLYSDSMNYPGQNIQIPRGLLDLNIQLYSNNYTATNGTLLSANASIALANWNLQLFFELYDPIDEM